MRLPNGLGMFVGGIVGILAELPQLVAASLVPSALQTIAEIVPVVRNPRTIRKSCTVDFPTGDDSAAIVRPSAIIEIACPARHAAVIGKRSRTIRAAVIRRFWWEMANSRSVVATCFASVFVNRSILA